MLYGCIHDFFGLGINVLAVRGWGMEGLLAKGDDGGYRGVNTWNGFPCGAPMALGIMPWLPLSEVLWMRHSLPQLIGIPTVRQPLQGWIPLYEMLPCLP